jgi:type IV pilus assembly protein PilC
MPIFQYTAMDSAGKEKKGKLEAENENSVASALKEQGLFPTSIKEAKSAGGNKRAVAGGGATGAKQGGSMFAGLNNLSLGAPVIKSKQLTLTTRQLAILLDAGLPLVRSLRTLEKQTKDGAVRRVLNETANAVESGSTFSEALSQNPKSFDKLYLNMVRAGEAAGALELILDRLAKFMEKAQQLAGKIKSAMMYPLIVLTLAGGITMGLMVFIVPKFKQIFEELLEGAPLPWLTARVIGLSQTITKGIGLTDPKSMISNFEGPVELIFLIVVLVILFKVIVSFKKGRLTVDWMKYKAPLIGSIISKTAIARFSRTLGTLMGSGVPVLQALQIVRDTSGNELVANGVQQVHDAVKEGEAMAGPLGATKIFPDMVVSMIEVGEETGKLPEMMEKIADTYEEEVDLAVDALTSMIEPLMIVFLAVVVGTIVIALFMPLVKIIETLGA